MEDDSDLQDGFPSGRRGQRTIRPGGLRGGDFTSRKHNRHCCHSFCKCMKCSFLIAFVLIICVGLLVILPLKIIFSEDRISYDF